MVRIIKTNRSKWGDASGRIHLAFNANGLYDLAYPALLIRLPKYRKQETKMKRL